MNVLNVWMNDTHDHPPPRNLSTYLTLPTYLIYPWSNSSQSGGFAKLKFSIFASQPFAAFAALRSPSFASLRFGSLACLTKLGPDQTRLASRSIVWFYFHFFHVMLLLYDVWFYSIVSLIHHLCKREMKRNVEAIICLVSSGMRFFVLHTYCTVQYCLHDMVFTRDGTRKFPKYRKKRSRLHLVECRVDLVWLYCCHVFETCAKSTREWFEWE